MERNSAWNLLNEHIKSDVLLKHCRATEVIMMKMAEKLGYDPQQWGIAGLLHDLDFEYTKDTPDQHGKKTMELLGNSLDEKSRKAILAHNECAGAVRDCVFDYALACSESVTGLIVATALVYPDKKVSSVKPKSVEKRMRQSGFARNVSRENIMECEKTGVPLMNFIELSIGAMSEISDELGL